MLATNVSGYAAPAAPEPSARKCSSPTSDPAAQIWRAAISFATEASGTHSALALSASADRSPTNSASRPRRT